MRSLPVMLIVWSVISYGRVVGATPGQSSPTGTVIWSSVASACVLDNAHTTGQAVFSATDGSVSFASGSTGEILLNCAITIPVPTESCKFLDLVATSPVASGFDVEAGLNATALGSTSGVTSLAFIGGVSTRDVYESAFSLSSWTFNSQFYYVNIGLFRANTTLASPVAYGVAISTEEVCE
jgi:hypothetical protein